MPSLALPSWRKPTPRQTPEVHIPATPPTPNVLDSPLRNVQADIAEEDSIRAAAAKSQIEPLTPPAPLLLFGFLALTMMASLCIGIVFGWPSIASILESVGIYGGADEETRAVRLTLLYTLASSALAFGGIPAGLLIDRVGPAHSALVAGVMVTTGFLGLAFLPASADDLFALPLMLLGAGGILTCFTAFRSAPLVPEHSQTVMISINTLFQMSSAVPALFYSLNEVHGVPRAVVFGSAAAYVTLLFGAWTIGWCKLERHLSAQALGYKTDANGKEKNGYTSAPTSAPAPAPACNTIPPLNPACSVSDAMRTPQYIFGVLWFITHQWRSNLYLGEVRYMLIELGDADESYQETFSACLLLAVLCIPLISYASSTLGLAGMMQAVTLLSLLHACSALVPSLGWQLITFAIYVPYRSAIFATASIYVAATFGFAKLGVVYGTFQSLGAVLSFTLPPLAALVLGWLDGDWSAVLWGCVVLSAVQLAIVSALLRATRGGAEEERRRLV